MSCVFILVSFPLPEEGTELREADSLPKLSRLKGFKFGVADPRALSSYHNMLPYFILLGWGKAMREPRAG